MQFNFFPKDVKFFDLFQEQYEKLREAVVIMNQIYHDFTDVENKCLRINMVEEDGDAIQRKIATQLSSTFITPIDREDIHDINVAQEAVLNLIRAIATRISLYGFTKIRFPAKKVVENLLAMVEVVGQMLQNLRDHKDVAANVKGIRSLKIECEMLLVVGLGEVYDSKPEDIEDLMEVFKWTHIYDQMEKTVNRMERLAEVIEGVALKHA